MMLLHVFLIPLGNALLRIFLDVQIMFYGKLVCQERSLCHTQLIDQIFVLEKSKPYSRYDLISI